MPASADPRPFWSVMVSVFDRPGNVEKALSSVLAQAEPDIPRIRDGIRECQTSEDLREGLSALREKRMPAFKGR